MQSRRKFIVASTLLAGIAPMKLEAQTKVYVDKLDENITNVQLNKITSVDDPLLLEQVERLRDEGYDIYYSPDHVRNMKPGDVMVTDFIRGAELDARDTEVGFEPGKMAAIDWEATSTISKQEDPAAEDQTTYLIARQGGEQVLVQLADENSLLHVVNSIYYVDHAAKEFYWAPVVAVMHNDYRLMLTDTGHGVGVKDTRLFNPNHLKKV